MLLCVKKATTEIVPQELVFVWGLGGGGGGGGEGVERLCVEMWKLMWKNVVICENCYF